MRAASYFASSSTRLFIAMKFQSSGILVAAPYSISGETNRLRVARTRVPATDLLEQQTETPS